MPGEPAPRAGGLRGPERGRGSQAGGGGAAWGPKGRGASHAGSKMPPVARGPVLSVTKNTDRPLGVRHTGRAGVPGTKSCILQGWDGRSPQWGEGNKENVHSSEGIGQFAQKAGSGKGHRRQCGATPHGDPLGAASSEHPLPEGGRGRGSATCAAWQGCGGSPGLPMVLLPGHPRRPVGGPRGTRPRAPAPSPEATRRAHPRRLSSSRPLSAARVGSGATALASHFGGSLRAAGGKGCHPGPQAQKRGRRGLGSRPGGGGAFLLGQAWLLASTASGTIGGGGDPRSTGPLSSGGRRRQQVHGHPVGLRASRARTRPSSSCSLGTLQPETGSRAPLEVGVLASGVPGPQCTWGLQAHLLGRHQVTDFVPQFLFLWGRGPATLSLGGMRTRAGRQWSGAQLPRTGGPETVATVGGSTAGVWGSF